MINRLPAFLLLLTLATLPVYAQTTTETKAEPAGSRLILSRINSFLAGDDLPQFDLPGTMKLTFRPHVSDFVRRDYLRTEVGLRWSLNEHFEINGEASTFITHGFGNSAGYGIGKLRTGARYVLEDWPFFGYDTSLALNMEAPVGHPPVDFTDGQYHLTPSFIVQRISPRNHHLTTFAGLGLDLIDDSSIPGQWSTNQPHEDSINGTVGASYDLGQLKYTLSFTYATTAWIGQHTNNFYYLQPGVQWYVPSRFTFHSKTQWIASFGINTSWGPDGTDISVRTRLRAEITFRQVMAKIRETTGKVIQTP